jgi:hypothetical protein
MAYSKKTQSLKVAKKFITEIIEGFYYKDLDATKNGVELHGYDDIIEGATFTYKNQVGAVVTATFKKVGNMDATYNVLADCRWRGLRITNIRLNYKI